MNIIKKLSLVAAIVAMVTLTATAQSPRPYVLGTLDGGTNAILAGSATNTTTIACSEYDSIGLQSTVKAMGAATSSVIVYGFASLDSSTYETAASYTNSIVLNGTTAVTTPVWDISIPNAATMKFVFVNTNASINVTNIIAKARFKAVNVRAKESW
jgi:hypothetical protein